jgi:hypothetical protein
MLAPSVVTTGAKSSWDGPVKRWGVWRWRSARLTAATQIGVNAEAIVARNPGTLIGLEM